MCVYACVHVILLCHKMHPSCPSQSRLRFPPPPSLFSSPSHHCVCLLVDVAVSPFLFLLRVQLQAHTTQPSNKNKTHLFLINVCMHLCLILFLHPASSACCESACVCDTQTQTWPSTHRQRAKDRLELLHVKDTKSSPSKNGCVTFLLFISLSLSV